MTRPPALEIRLLAATALLGGCVAVGTSDFDRDGWDDSDDCAPFDSTIHPGADEVCGDGLDNNCNAEFDERNGLGCVAWFRGGDWDGAGALVSACLCAPEAPFTAPWRTTATTAISRCALATSTANPAGAPRHPIAARCAMVMLRPPRRAAAGRAMVVLPPPPQRVAAASRKSCRRAS